MRTFVVASNCQDCFCWEYRLHRLTSFEFRIFFKTFERFQKKSLQCLRNVFETFRTPCFETKKIQTNQNKTHQQENAFFDVWTTCSGEPELHCQQKSDLNWKLFEDSFSFFKNYCWNERLRRTCSLKRTTKLLFPRCWHSTWHIFMKFYYFVTNKKTSGDK